MRASGRSILLMTTIGCRPDGERLAEHEARLRQRPLGGVDEQERAVGHLQDALDLAAEVGVAGRVDEVDLDVADADGDVLGQDGDAALALQVVGVQDEAVLAADELVQLLGAEQAGLPEHLIDQGGLAVVDVGDDGDVADVVPLHVWVRNAFGLEESNTSCNVEVRLIARKGRRCNSI